MKTLRPTRRSVLAGAGALAIAAHAQAADAVKAGSRPFKLVMLGDSLTEGFGLKPSQAVPAVMEANLHARGVTVRVVNAGVSGNTSGDVLARFDKAMPSDAQGLLIAVGANDMLQLFPPKFLADNLRAMLDRAKSRDLQVALAGMRTPGFVRGAYQEQFDAVYPALAREYNTPLYPFLLEGVIFDPALNLDDGIHPNARGAKIIADRLTPFVMSAFDFTGAGRGAA